MRIVNLTPTDINLIKERLSVYLEHCGTLEKASIDCDDYEMAVHYRKEAYRAYNALKKVEKAK